MFIDYQLFLFVSSLDPAVGNFIKPIPGAITGLLQAQPAEFKCQRVISIFEPVIELRPIALKPRAYCAICWDRVKVRWMRKLTRSMYHCDARVYINTRTTIVPPEVHPVLIPAVPA